MVAKMSVLLVYVTVAVLTVHALPAIPANRQSSNIFWSQPRRGYRSQSTNCGWNNAECGVQNVQYYAEKSSTQRSVESPIDLVPATPNRPPSRPAPPADHGSSSNNMPSKGNEYLPPNQENNRPYPNAGISPNTSHRKRPVNMRRHMTTTTRKPSYSQSQSTNMGLSNRNGNDNNDRNVFRPSNRYNAYNHPQYNPPQYSAPQYVTPQYNRPQYSPPQYNPPQYNQPQYNQPQYNQPRYNQAQYNQAQYNAPQYTPRPTRPQPQYSSFDYDNIVFPPNNYY